MGPFQAEQVTALENLSNSAAATRRLGARIGELASAGDVILLSGGLGVGKTCLTQGIARGLGIAEPVSSPSFVLVRQYQGRLALYHVDLYRLEHVEEVTDLGLDDYLYGHGVCVIEWAERGMPALPVEHLLIKMEYVGLTRRKLTLVPRGPRYVEITEKLRSVSPGAKV